MRKLKMWQMETFIIIVIGGLLIYRLYVVQANIKREFDRLGRSIRFIESRIKPSDYQEEKKKPANVTVKSTQNVTVFRPLEVANQRMFSKSENKPKVEAQPIKKDPVLKPIETPIEEPVKTEKIVEKATKKEEKPKRDYEKLIGENWLNKIGIAILVIGLGFFVKYAIDKDWINEIGRVAIGLFAGGILAAIGHRLRKNYRAFSSVLIGGAISVFYFTVTIAYQEYGLFSQTGAFITLSMITLASTLSAIYYDRKELAIIALIGGFTSPFMVQNGDGNYITFFTYISILNTGMLVLSYFKNWKIILQLALFFTLIYFGGWLITSDVELYQPALWSTIFATIYFVQFLGAIFIFNFVRKINYRTYDFIQIAGITALYYSAVLYTLNQYEFLISGAGFTLILSFFFAGLAILSYYRKGIDRALTFLLIGKGLLFTTLTGALMFDGYYMTKYWAVEAVLILIIGKLTAQRILKSASVIMTITTVFSLVRDWLYAYLFEFHEGAQTHTTIFITGIFVMLSLLVTFFQIRKEKEHKHFLIVTHEYILTVGALIFMVAYATCLLELLQQIKSLPYQSTANLILWIYHLLFVGIGLWLSKLQKALLTQQVFFFLSVIGVFIYLMFGQLNHFELLQDIRLQNVSNGFYFLHYAPVVGIIVLMWAIRHFSASIFNSQQNRNIITTIISIAGLIISTVEMELFFRYAFNNQYFQSTIVNHVRTEGYTILCAVYSFIIMIIGMRTKNKLLRILSLILFCLALIKLFTFDIRVISEAGKIIAFISLGVLLLVISFMYQKLKNLIVG